MTRETKIGLGVAGSFVCLVCIVVASKWRGGDGSHDPVEPSEPKVAAAKPLQQTSPLDGKKEGAGRRELPPKSPTAPVSSPAFPDPPVAPMPLPPLLPVGDTRTDVGPSRPMPTTDFPSPPMLPPPSATLTFPLNDGKGAAGVAPPPTLPAPPVLPQDTPGAGQTGGPAVLTFPPPPSLPADPVRAGGPPDLPMPPNLGAFGSTTPISDAQKNPAVVKPKNEGTTLPPLDAKFPVPPPTGSTPGITVLPPSDYPVVPPPPRIGSSELPSTPPISTLPDRGVFTPPAVINAGNPPMPVIKDVSVDVDACLPGETNFALIALRFYGNDKYADALLEYNKRHASQLRNGAAMLANPRALASGQQVLRPPVGILERDYGTLIPGNRPAMPTIPSTVPAVKLSTPSPLVTMPGAAPVSTPPTVASRSYRVQNPNGESILDIAERQLGDRGRWNEIHRLNPTYQPQFRIPAGAELKLPG